MSDEGREQDRIPAEYLIEIGRVTVEWATLESALDLGLIKLAGMSLEDSRALSIFAHMSFPLKLDVFGSLVTELQPKYPNLKDLQTIVRQLKKAQDGRNAIIHAKWGFENGQVQIARMTARGHIKTSIRPIPLDEIQGITKQINETTKAVFRFVTSGHKNPAY